MKVRRHLVVALVVLASLAGAAQAAAAVPFRDISAPSGPIEHVYLGDELSCQVELLGDTDLSFYPADIGPLGNASIPGDCGTFLASEGELYAPNFAAHDVTATSMLLGGAPGGLNGDQPSAVLTPVSQDTVSGAGTAASPYTVTTTVDAGATGLRIAQTDSYVTGESSYETDITVTNFADAPRQATLYHVADCYLANSDYGFGWVIQRQDASFGGVFCSENPNNDPRGRLIGFVPEEPANYVETQWPDENSNPGGPQLWSLVNESGAPLPDLCRCTYDAGDGPGSGHDNGAGLSWALSVPSGESVSRSFLTTLSASGVTSDPPETAITSGPAQNEVLTTQTATFTFSSDEPGSFECKLDDGEFSFCETPFTTPVLANGTHTFEVRAIDIGGTVDSSPATRDFVIDFTTGGGGGGTGPDTEITDGPAPDELLTTSIASFEFSSSEAGSSFECSVDGGAFTACETPFTTAALADGGHRFEVRAKDADGNVDPSPAQREFGTAATSCVGRTVTLYLGFGDHTLAGTPGDDVIIGGPESDKLDGGGGNDRVCDFGGNDLLKGGAGNDKLRGGAGNDKLKGGGAKDVLVGQDGNDKVSGGPGDDKLKGNAGDDALKGGAGEDTCTGGAGEDTEKSCE